MTSEEAIVEEEVAPEEIAPAPSESDVVDAATSDPTGSKKAPQLIGSASFANEALNVIGRAFDEAWNEVQPTIGETIHLPSKQATEPRKRRAVLGQRAHP